MKEPLISVVVPVHNCEKTVEKAVSSILLGTYKNFEILLINNGSTDESLAVCQRLVSIDDRVVLFDTGDKSGAGLARNVGIEKSRGEYIYFLDSDDECEHDILSKFIEVFETTKVDVVICGHSTFAEGTDFVDHHMLDATTLFGDEYKKFVAEKLPDGTIGFLWNKLYKADIIKNNNLRFRELSRLEDGFFNIEYFSRCNSLSTISDELYKYRLSTSEQVIQKHDMNYYDLYVELIDKTKELRENFGTLDASKEIMYGLCLDEFGTCVENAFLSDWGRDKKIRYEFLDRIRNSEIFSETYEYEFKTSEKNKYRWLLAKLLKSRRYIVLKFIVVLKTFAKTKLRTLYYKAK